MEMVVLFKNELGVYYKCCDYGTHWTAWSPETGILSFPTYGVLEEYLTDLGFEVVQPKPKKI